MVADRTVAEVVETLTAAGVPVGPVYSIPQLMQDEHIRSREMIVELEYPDTGKVPVPGLAVKLSQYAWSHGPARSGSWVSTISRFMVSCSATAANSWQSFKRAGVI